MSSMVPGATGVTGGLARTRPTLLSRAPSRAAAAISGELGTIFVLTPS